jgi:hypothetical protein
MRSRAPVAHDVFMAGNSEKAGPPRGRRLGGRSLFARSRTAGRCPVCGKEVSTGDDFVHVHGYVVHSDCALHSPETRVVTPDPGAGQSRGEGPGREGEAP